MSEARAVTVAELRGIVTDPSELAKGTEIADKGGITNLARHENKLFADAAGSSLSPYKTQITFGDGKITARCSCMAARSRPYCKHAAALLVSWARTPEAFSVATAPPVAREGGKRATVKRGKVDATALRKKGVEQASTLLVELWQTGVDALAADRATQVAELAPTLRELGLRRLSARTLELAELLALAARRDGSLAAETYASLVADMWLTARKLEKHLAGEALADEHVEELIGRTWTKKDRKPIAGLDLVEYAYASRTTADGFVIRESRHFDVASGEHFVEKQILPAMIAKRMPPLPSRAGQILHGASGSIFPSFAPRRIDVAAPGARGELDAAALERLAERALPSVTAALEALAARRRDVFAPPWVPVLVRADTIVSTAGRVLFVDDAGGALFLAGGRSQESALVTALASVSVHAVFGDVGLEGALPALTPLAVLGRVDGELRLLPLSGSDDEPDPPKTEAVRAHVAPAAALLDDVRSDLARGFQEGAAVAATQRFLAPLVARLTELKLAKQAELLREMPAVADPADSLDALVKVYQVLGIAVSRLASVARLDRASLVRVPTMPSVAIPRPPAALSPEAAIAAEGRGELHRFERAYHVATHYKAVHPSELLRDTTRFWSDGDAVPFVLAAAKADRAAAIASAVSVLSQATGPAWGPVAARLGKLTAIRVLAGTDHPAARRALDSVSPKEHDQALVSYAARAAGGRLLQRETLEDLTAMVTGGSSKEHRIDAITGIVIGAAFEAIPTLRAALRDRTADVRKAAAYALAALGDAVSLETFVMWLGSDDRERAKLGAHAIGQLGDVRGAGALLAALRRGFSPVVVVEALTLLGAWVLGPLLDLAEAEPGVVKPASLASVVRSLPAEQARPALLAWLAASEGDPRRLASRAKIALEATTQRPDLAKPVAEYCDGRAKLAGDDKEWRALRKKIDAAIGGPKRARD